MKPALRSSFFLAILVFPLTLLAQNGSPAVDESSFPFSSEVRAPVIYQSIGRGEAPISAGIDFYRYHGTRRHDREHPNLFSEDVVGAMSSFHVGVMYQPDPELDLLNKGITALLEGVRIVSSRVAVGAIARFSRITLEQANSHATDLEIGPQVSFWSAGDLYINEKVSIRFIKTFADSAPDIQVARGNSFQLRHHISYVPSEDWSFTYAQDLSLRIGTISEPHVDNINERNYFIFSFSPQFSLRPMIGVNLDYFTGLSTSVLTIPVGLSGEYFIGGGIMVNGGVEYDTPTMSGQPSDHFSVVGAIGYRF